MPKLSRLGLVELGEESLLGLVAGLRGAAKRLLAYGRELEMGAGLFNALS